MPVKNFRISTQGIFHVPKIAQMRTVDGGVFLRKVYSSTAEFRATDGNHLGGGLVDILTMCLLFVSFGGGRIGFGRYKPTKIPILPSLPFTTADSK